MRIHIIPMLIAIIAGALFTTQSVFNTALGEKVGIYGALLIVFIGNLLTLGVLLFLHRKGMNLGNIGSCRWYLFLGGVLGVMILAAIIYIMPKLGAATGFSAILIGQLILAVIIDHYALLNVPKTEISFFRIIGIILLIIGAYLTRI